MNIPRVEKYVLFIVMIIFSGHNTLLAQNISITLQKTDTLNHSDENLFITDLNGDTCSLAIVKTNMKNIKFYTNRSVEKIESTESEYRVWIANGSTVLKMVIPDSPLLEYKLPFSGNQPVLYILILQVAIDELKSMVVFNDTLDQVFSITTFPRDAKLYLNNLLVGNTPSRIPINIPDVTFTYKIVKTGYVPIKGTDSTRYQDYSLTFDLTPRSSVEMNFIKFQVGRTDFNSTWWDENWNSYRNWQHTLYGISVGKTGGLGWYASSRIGFLTRALEGPLTSPRFNDFRLTSGLTQSLTKYFQSYAKLGLGYAFSKDSYSDYYGTDIIYNINGLCFDMGLIFKIGSRMVISAEWNLILGKKVYAYSVSNLNLGGELTFGIGYGFTSKKLK